jgi:CheY-like chemotaxis protein
MKRGNQSKLSFQRIAFFLIVITGLIYSYQKWISLENEKYDQALQVAESLSATLPKEDVKALKAKLNDIKSSHFQNINDALKDIIQSNPKAKYVYLFTEKYGKIFTLAKPLTNGSNDYSPPGQEYAESKPEIRQWLMDGKVLVTKNIVNKRETYISVFIPLKDAISGKIIAVFGMDFMANSLNEEILIKVINSSLLVAFLLLTILLLIKITANNKYIKTDLAVKKQTEAKLLESVEKIRYNSNGENESDVADTSFGINDTNANLLFKSDLQTNNKGIDSKNVNVSTSLLKVLIAEDDEGAAKLISIYLKTLSREIIKVKTGVEAVEVCRNHPDIDLVLMDIQMPDMNGYQATRQIKAFNKDIIIIAQTAYALPGEREKSIEAGCNDYIAKPIKKLQLLGIIQNHFNEQESATFLHSDMIM